MFPARSLFLPIAFVFATGCASVPMAPLEADLASKKFEVAPDKANLYVYRNESLGSAVRMSVLLDGAHLGDTAAKTYLYTPIAPGKHTLVSKAENDSTLIIDARAGSNHFLWQEVKMGFWSARSSLQLITDEQQGRKGVAECKLAQTNTPPSGPSLPITPAPDAIAVNDFTRLPHSSPRMVEGYRTFLTKPLPRAFAISETGLWWITWGTTPERRNQSADPSQRAVQECESNFKSKCLLYAVDNSVVYKPSSTDSM